MCTEENLRNERRIRHEKSPEKEHGMGMKPSKKTGSQEIHGLQQAQADVQGQEEEGLVRKIL